MASSSHLSFDLKKKKGSKFVSNLKIFISLINGQELIKKMGS